MGVEIRPVDEPPSAFVDLVSAAAIGLLVAVAVWHALSGSDGLQTAMALVLANFGFWQCRVLVMRAAGSGPRIELSDGRASLLGVSPHVTLAEAGDGGTVVRVSVRHGAKQRHSQMWVGADGTVSWGLSELHWHPHDLERARLATGRPLRHDDRDHDRRSLRAAYPIAKSRTAYRSTAIALIANMAVVFVLINAAN